MISEIMVVTHNFQDILELTSKTTSLCLPTFKENLLKIDFEKDTVIETVYEGKTPLLPFADSDVFYAALKKWRRLTADDEACKPVYEVTLDITCSNFTFQPGDTIGVVPQNNQEDIDFIITHLNLASQADVAYSLSVDGNVKAKIPAHIPVKSTLRKVLTSCVDLRGVVKKQFILALSKHTKEENERKILEYICSKEGSNTYRTHILDKGLCILDIFTIFKTCKPPIELILANLPRLLPRPYSIANSQGQSNIIKICFSVIDLGNNRKGLTTGWLESVILNSIPMDIEDKLEKLNLEDRHIDCKVPIYKRKNMSEFSMPEDLAVPLVLIGPGTGVSPFIGFLEEREAIQKTRPDVNLGQTWLFFGCRNPKLDFIYEDELNGFMKKGILNKLSVAFSRVEKCEFKYVQDALQAEGEEIIKIILTGAAVYICGDSKTMGVQIRDILIKCLVKYCNKTLEEAEEYIVKMQKEKRYFVDVWS